VSAINNDSNENNGFDTNPVSSSFDQSGAFGGAQIGYNRQGAILGPRVVLGIEADMQASGIQGKGSASAASAQPLQMDDGNVNASVKSHLDWFGTIRGRLGYAFDHTLFYATGGFAFGRVRDKLSVSETSFGEPLLTASSANNQTATGFVVGGGLEYAINPAWSLKGEYQYIDLGSTNLSASNTNDGGLFDLPAASAKVDHTYHTVRIGLNYHVMPSYEPLK
jgi:outer membrane immunogenic protein